MAGPADFVSPDGAFYVYVNVGAYTGDSLGAGTSVTDTAMRLGWSNPSSFIEAFTDLVGETPGRYRVTARASHG